MCEECGHPGERVIRFKGHVSPDNRDAYFNYGLGAVVRSKNDVRQKLAQIKGETGQEVIDVGNERIHREKPRKSGWVDEKVIYEYQRVKGGKSKH